MESTSESDHDGGVTSGEDSSFERSGVGSQEHSDADGQYTTQQQQLPHQVTQSQLQNLQYLVGSTVGTDHQSSGMLMPGNYLPFMMPSSYPAMMMQNCSLPSSATSAVSQPAAASSFFSQNSLAKDCDVPVAAGSPLNLQTGNQEQTRIGSEFNGSAVPQPQQRSLPSAAASPGLQQARASPHLASSSPYPQPAHQAQGSPALATYGGIPNSQALMQGRFPGEAGFGRELAMGKPDAAAKPPEYPPPPKRPLTPYMRFNRQMWEKVKASNPSMGVCEISAAIGRLWRELGPEEKQRHNDEYTLDKARYDEELKAYLKATGLRSSDLVRQKPKKKKVPTVPQPRRPAAAPPVPSQPTRPTTEHPQQHQQQTAQLTANQQQQQLQALMGLPMGAGSLPIGMPMGFQNMGMLSGFPQMWATAAGQQYPGGLVSAGQLQELYGGVNGVEAPPPAHSQQPSAGADSQTSALYRYPQSFM